MRESSQRPVRLKAPGSSSPFSYSWRYRRRGYDVFPGKYYVTAYKNINGVMTLLSEKREILYVPLSGKNFSEEEMKNITVFFDKFMKLDREFSALSSVIGKMNEGIKYLKKALPETRKENGEIQTDLLVLQKKLRNISDKLYGDSTLRSRTEPAKPGISGYFWDLGGKVGSVLRPIRESDRNYLKDIKDMFQPIKVVLKIHLV